MIEKKDENIRLALLVILKDNKIKKKPQKTNKKDSKLSEVENLSTKLLKLTKLLTRYQKLQIKNKIYWQNLLKKLTIQYFTKYRQIFSYQKHKIIKTRQIQELMILKIPYKVDFIRGIARNERFNIRKNFNLLFEVIIREFFDYLDTIICKMAFKI